jgi:hypothetical protein
VEKRDYGTTFTKGYQATDTVCLDNAVWHKDASACIDDFQIFMVTE